MLIAVFSAKGSPGVTSSALALAAVWPRPAILLEADPTGADLTYRCRSTTGEPLAPTPSLLGLAASLRGGRQTVLAEWTQPLACGVDVVGGVATAAQSRGMGDLWMAISAQAAGAECDVIADLGRLTRDAPTTPMVVAADVRVPVVASTVESVMHTRALLGDVVVHGGRTVPLMIGPGRSARADSEDLDRVLIDAGVIAADTRHIPLDHPGLVGLQNGVRPDGRGRGSQLIRAARSVAADLVEIGGMEEVVA